LTPEVPAAAATTAADDASAKRSVQ